MSKQRCDRRRSDDEAREARVTRRRFLATSAGAAGAAAAGGLEAVLGGCAARKEDQAASSVRHGQQAGPEPETQVAADEKQAPVEAKETVAAGPLPKRKLGRTGLEVTAFSMGAIGAETDVFRAGLDAGVNFIHCAMGYETLDRVAAAIAGRREGLFIGMKYERPGSVDWQYLDRAFELLQVDHVDILFFPLHSPEPARDRSHLDFFEQVKKRNKARFIGITAHREVAPTMQAAVEAGFWDVLMPAYAPAPKEREALLPILDKAEKQNLGVVAMKTLAGIQAPTTGQMQAIAKQVLADSSVSTLCKGVLTFESLGAFLRVVGEPPTAAETASLQHHLAACRGQTCLLCGACPTCKRGVNVFEVIRAFDYYYAQAARPEVARMMYHMIPPSQRASSCDDCGECASKCPYGVDIARHVRAAHVMLA